ncbi:MAG: hypothetical protein WC369_10355 [Dehalococcoidales bacterium]|jgi:hypothetical protein
MSLCPLDNMCALGNCEFCSQKEDCVLLAIFQKITKLELIMAKDD